MNQDNIPTNLYPTFDANQAIATINNNEKAPLYQQQTTSITTYQKIPSSGKTSCCARCCKCMCCCCVCQLVLCCIIVLAIILSGGAFGIYVGVKFNQCVSGRSISNFTMDFDENIKSIVMDNYGDIEIISTDGTFGGEFYSYLKENEEIDFDQQDDVLYIKAPKEAFWGKVCQGYDAKLYIPVSKKINLDITNSYGLIKSETEQKLDFGNIKINKKLGMIFIKNLRSSSLNYTSKTSYAHFNSFSTFHLYGNVEYGSTTFKNSAAVTSEFNSKFHNLVFKEFTSTSLKVHQKYNELEFNNSTFIRVDLESQYGNAIFINSKTLYPVFNYKGKNSNLMFENIENAKWGTLSVNSETKYSIITLNRVKKMSLYAFDVEDLGLEVSINKDDLDEYDNIFFYFKGNNTKIEVKDDAMIVDLLTDEDDRKDGKIIMSEQEERFHYMNATGVDCNFKFITFVEN